MRLPPLLQVPRVLQTAAAPLTALNHIVDLVSDFLDVSTGFSIPTAASSKSTLLMERVVMRVTSDHNLSPVLLSRWFGQALEEAIKINDLTMVQKIHTLHPEPLDVYSLRLAMEFGSLEMVQWAIEHRHDRLCCSPGVKNLCELCLDPAMSCLGKQDAVRVVEWLAAESAIKLTVNNRSPLWPPLSRSVELMKWCYDRGLIRERVGAVLLDNAIRSEHVEALVLAHFLVTRGFTIERKRLIDDLVDAACNPKRVSMAEFLVSSPLCDRIRHCFEYAPTRSGGAKVLQWSREFMDDPKNARVVGRMTYTASNWLHLDTLKWLYEERGIMPSDVDQPSHQELLQYHAWRLQVGWTTGTIEDIEWAASNGYLDVLQWLHTHRTAEYTTDVMDFAARGGHLTVVQWLHDNSPVDCTTAAMDYAAEYGHLEVVQWLHHNRTEGCTRRAVEWAAFNGHVDTVQWLCKNRSEHNATAAMVEAATDGQLHVLQWLYENLDDACAPCALKRVVECSYGFPSLSSLQWLRERPRKASCTGRCDDRARRLYWLGRSAATNGDLALLEYVMEYFPETEPPGELLTLVDPTSSLSKDAHSGVVEWVRARQHERGDQNHTRDGLLGLSQRCSIM